MNDIDSPDFGFKAMKCPHCLVETHEFFNRYPLNSHGSSWLAEAMICPLCKKTIIMLQETEPNGPCVARFIAYPKGTARRPIPPEVPPLYVADYTEAGQVLDYSEKASAALSRRCLQAILRDVAKVKPQDLSKEIAEVIASKTLPTHIADAIDGIRVIGNFAAHPLKDTNTGEILDVEPHEAEWCLDVLESLFDFYFVAPARLASKKAALNAKLQAAKKPPMK